MRRTVLSRSLSAKILLLTIACVFLGEVLIYVPSIARFRLTYLQERIAAAHLAMLNLTPDLAQQLDMDMVDTILAHAGVLAVTVRGSAGETLMLGEITAVDRVHDLRDDSWTTLVHDALESLAHRGERLLRVIGPSPQETGTIVDIIVPEAPMWSAMVDYSVRILTLSVVLSVLVAAMLFIGLQRMIVQPLRRITAELATFRERPEDSTADGPQADRADEIGVVEQELATMRHGLRQALAEKTRLAALGAAMSRISHDLKNILATAVLISDRLESSADPVGAPRGAAPDRDARPRGAAVRRDAELRPQRPAGPATAAGRARRARAKGTRRLDGPLIGNVTWRHRAAVAARRSWSTPISCSGCCSTSPRMRWRPWASAAASCGSRPGSAPSCSRSRSPTPGPAFPSRSAPACSSRSPGSSKAAGNGLGPRHLPRADAGAWRRDRAAGNLRARHRLSPAPAGAPVRARARCQESRHAAGDRSPGSCCCRSCSRRPAATTRGRRWPATRGCRIQGSSGTTTTMRWSRTRPAPSRGCARSPGRAGGRRDAASRW